MTEVLVVVAVEMVMTVMVMVVVEMVMGTNKIIMLFNSAEL